MRDDIASPIALAYDLRTDDPDAEVEVACHSRHHMQLPKVLLAEDRDIGAASHEQLADDGGNTTEDVRPEAVFQSRGCRTFRNNPRCEAIRVLVLMSGFPDDVHRFGSKPCDIGLPRPRVSAVVFRRSELSRIDENRDNDTPRASFGEAHQRHVPVMECAHGWHRCDSGFPVAIIVEGALQGAGRSGDEWGDGILVRCFGA